MFACCNASECCQSSWASTNVGLRDGRRWCGGDAKQKLNIKAGYLCGSTTKTKNSNAPRKCICVPTSTNCFIWKLADRLAETHIHLRRESKCGREGISVRCSMRVHNHGVSCTYPRSWWQGPQKKKKNIEKKKHHPPLVNGG